MKYYDCQNQSKSNLCNVLTIWHETDCVLIVLGILVSIHWLFWSPARLSLTVTVQSSVSGTDIDLRSPCLVRGQGEFEGGRN